LLKGLPLLPVSQEIPRDRGHLKSFGEIILVKFGGNKKGLREVAVPENRQFMYEERLGISALFKGKDKEPPCLKGPLR